MSYLIDAATTRAKSSFKGYQQITKYEDKNNKSKIGVAVYVMKPQEKFTLALPLEAAFLLMHGAVSVTVAGQQHKLERKSLFDESASCVHAGIGETIEIVALKESEFTVYEIENPHPFPSKVYLPKDVPNEHRGLEMVDNAAYRYVRTIFDDKNTPSECLMVLGEVVTFPGKWSSYPPHHHPQPEIYHYRFDKPQGYGYAQMGKELYTVKNFDSLCILDEKDHAQVAAPGYAMYYSWVIRHLEGNRYTVPTFTEEHNWTQQPGAKSWKAADAKI